MEVDEDSGRPSLSFIVFVMGGLMVAFTVGGFLLWDEAGRIRAAAEGDHGTLGTFTAVGLQSDGMTKSCHGTFRPDGGGAERRDVKVNMADCVQGATRRVRMTDGLGVLPGADGWKARRAGAVTMWVFVPLMGVLGVIAFNSPRSPKSDEPGGE